MLLLLLYVFYVFIGTEWSQFRNLCRDLQICAWLFVPIFVGGKMGIIFDYFNLPSWLPLCVEQVSIGSNYYFVRFIQQKDIQLLLSAVDVEPWPHPPSWSSLQLKLDQCPHPQRTFDILTWSHHCIVVGFHPDSGCMMSRLHFTCLYIEIQQLNEHFREPCSLCVFLCESWVFFVKINFIFSLGLWYLYAWFCSLSYVMWTWVVAFFVLIIWLCFLVDSCHDFANGSFQNAADVSWALFSFVWRVYIKSLL